MTAEPANHVAVSESFVDAMNRRDHDAAAQLLADNVELVFPGARLTGRDAWLESRRRQQPPEHLDETVEVDGVAETENGVEVSGRLVQRWLETGEVASEMPIRIVFAVDDGAITKLELRPDA